MEKLKLIEESRGWLPPGRFAAEVLNNLPCFILIFDRKSGELVFENHASRIWPGREILQPALPALLFELFRNNTNQAVLIHEVTAVNQQKYIFKTRFSDFREDPELLLVSTEEMTDILSGEPGFSKSREGILDTRKKETVSGETDQRIEELNRSNSQLEDFAYVASHDLQEPLRKILAFGERLQKKHHQNLPEDGQLYLDRMMSSTMRMRILIDNLLTLSRVSRKPEEHERVNLQTLVEEIISDFDLRIDELGGRIQAEGLPEIDGNKTQLYQLFQNLISNSLKFSRAETPPVIEIFSREAWAAEVKARELDPELRYWCIEIKDNGIGFEQKDAEVIFNVFHRLHGRSEYEGTGIGLAICKKVVINHRGSIFAFSEEGRGTSISILLPS